MEEKISFESSLFGEGNEVFIDDIEFCVNRIVIFPKIRPQKLEKIVDLSAEYCKSVHFRRKLLEKSKKCPVLIYQLYKRGILVFGEIEPFLNEKDEDTFLFSCYFRKEIHDFEIFISNKKKPLCFDESLFKNENKIDQMIEFGFLPSSIEYCLKYDVIDDLLKINNLYLKAEWSPFEWSARPKNIDLLSFAGFFCSIKCFKHLLMTGIKINDNVTSMVVCGGCLDLFHLCQGQQLVTSELVCNASEFFHLPLLVFMIENGADINAKSDFVEFL